MTRAARCGASAAEKQHTEDSMNWDQIEGKWKEYTGKAQQRWGELTNDDLAQVKGDRRELSGKIQNAYGVSKEEAERQIDDWMATES
jgi:uncharacterized protein YjbJ (UPF0337 family)